MSGSRDPAALSSLVAGEIAPWQIAGVEVDMDLALKGAGEVGHLLDRTFDIADAVNCQRKSRFVVLAFGFEFTEPLLQIGEQVSL